MRNKRAEFKITSMLIGTLLAFGLFFTMISSTIIELGGVYDISGYDNDSLASYSHLDTLTADLQEQSNAIDRDVSVDKNIVDYMAGIFSKVLSPFKFIYKSYTNLFTVTDQAVNDLHLFDEFGMWAKATIITLVVVGIVMFGIYLKVKQ